MMGVLSVPKFAQIQPIVNAFKNLKVISKRIKTIVAAVFGCYSLFSSRKQTNRATFALVQCHSSLTSEYGLSIFKMSKLFHFIVFSQ